MTKRKPTTRSRTPDQLASLYGRRLDRTIRTHEHVPGVDECFAILVCGQGKNASARMVNPWGWNDDDLTATLDGWLLNRNEWGRGIYSHAGNIHEMARAFMDWVARQSETIPAARNFAVLVAHPEGAATFYYRGQDMRNQLISTVTTLAADRFA